MDGGNGLGDVAAVAVHRGEATERFVLHPCCGGGVEHRSGKLLSTVEAAAPCDRLDHPCLHGSDAIPYIWGQGKGLVVQSDGSTRGDRDRLVGRAQQPVDGIEVAA